MQAPSKSGPTLILVPTELEARRIEDEGGLEGAGEVALCGFGPIAAAARTATLIASLHPSRVFLVGIAGTYDETLAPIGSALEFDQVAVEGIGVGEGERAMAPPALGFRQWPGREETGTPSSDERLPLAGSGESQGLLLTTCSASDTTELVTRRRGRFPQAIAEDMEGFGVALAALASSTPVRILRGISNVAGDRDPSHWRIPAALRAVRERLLQALELPL